MLKPKKPVIENGTMVSRRDFLIVGGATIVSAVFFNSLTGCSTKTTTVTTTATDTKTDTVTTAKTVTLTTAPPADSTDNNMLGETFITLSKASDGQMIHFNMVKFTGTVSSPDAMVVVNGVQAVVGTNGDYYVYLDLPKGQNVIQVNTTLNGEVSTDQVTVTFMPPLAIALNESAINANTDYTNTPLVVDGVVSDPSALVNVNGVPVTVTADGSFTAQVLLQAGATPNLAGLAQITATAASGGDSASAVIAYSIGDNGTISKFNHPGNMPSQIMYDGQSYSFNLKAGETASLGIVLYTSDDFGIGPCPVRYDTVASANNGSSPQNSADEFPLPTGMEVTITPAKSFNIYQKLFYHSLVNITTTTESAAGAYSIYFNLYNENAQDNLAYIYVPITIS